MQGRHARIEQHTVAVTNGRGFAWTWAFGSLVRGLLARLNVVHVADSPVLDMLHMLYAGLCSTEGGWGELITFLTTLRQGPRNLLLLLTMLHMLAYAQQGGWGGLITFLTTLRQDPRNLPFDRPCTDTSNWPSSLQCKIGAAWTQRHRWKKHGSALCTVNFKLNFPRSKRKTTTLSASLSASSPCPLSLLFRTMPPCSHVPMSPCPRLP